MTDTAKRDEPEDLSVSEKILRVQDLWDDIARSSSQVALTPAQLEEAERRLRAHGAHPGDYASWEEIRGRLERERWTQP
jgi:putative addiction module component (TIGR02574 family)